MLSLELIFFFLGLISWPFFIFVTAFQIVKPDTRIKLFQYSIPVWIWFCGMLASSSLMVLFILDKTGLLLWLKEDLISALYLFLLFLVFFYSVLISFVIQFSWGTEKLDNKKRILLSILSGFVTSIGLSAFFASLWIIWGSGRNADVTALICILIPAQVVVTIGTNSQLKWRRKFEEKSKAYYESQLPTNEK